jgi:ribokinase
LTSVDRKPFLAQKQLIKELPHILVSFDPGEIYARKGLKALKPIIQKSSVVLPSEGELKMLTGKGWKDGARILLKEGAGIVAVKLGERGCYVSDGKETHLIEPFKVKVVDTTGAGDAFCAGFIYGLVMGKDLYQCGRLGNFVASRCITQIGARKGLPRLNELEAALK